MAEWDLSQTPHDTLSGTGVTTHSGIDDHVDTYAIHFPWQDVYDLVTTTSGYLHDHIKGVYVDDVYPSDENILVYSSDSDMWIPSDFGLGVGEYHFDGDEAELATNSTSWINRLTLTASGVDSGEYRLGWYYEYRLNKAGKTLYVRIALNDDHVNLMHDVSLSMIQTTNYVSSAGFYHETLSSGTYHIDVDWKISSATGGTVAYLRRVRLEFWRVN